VHILQQVTLTERMSSCSLVQQSWREAAAAATTSITITDIPPATAAALVGQLSSNGTIWTQHITRISLEQRVASVSVLEVVLPQLACPKLRQLHVSGFILTPTATTQSSSEDSGSADSGAAGTGSEDSGAADVSSENSSSEDNSSQDSDDNSDQDGEDSSSHDSGAQNSGGPRQRGCRQCELHPWLPIAAGVVPHNLLGGAV
jgi:hypothetical protein